MKKNTEELVNEIMEGKNMAEYLASNAEEFLDIPLCAHLKELLKKKGMRVSQVADRSNKGEKWIRRFADLKPVVIYSMWEGYVNPAQKAYDKELHEFVRRYHAVPMHTSGHAPAGVIEEVINRVSPREAIIPIHTENREGFWKLNIREELKGRIQLSYE